MGGLEEKLEEDGNTPAGTKGRFQQRNNLKEKRMEKILKSRRW